MSDDTYVLDASALLAAMLYEPGGERVADILDRSIISAVNLSEVVATLQDKGVPDENVDGYLATATSPSSPSTKLSRSPPVVSARRPGIAACRSATAPASPSASASV